MSSIPGVNNDSSSPYQVTQADAGVVEGQETIKSVTIIGDGGSISTLNYQTGKVSIQDYVGTQSIVLSYLEQLFKNIGSDTFLELLKAQGGLAGYIPSGARIRNIYDSDVALLNSANEQISALNTFNSALGNLTAQLKSQAANLQDVQLYLGINDPSNVLDSQLSALSTLISNFEAQYPDSMSLSSFQSQLSSIILNMQNAYDRQNVIFNNGGDNLASYNAAIQNYNNQIANPNPPVSQTSYDDAVLGIVNANLQNAQSGNFYPTLQVPPSVIVNSLPIQPTGISFTNGQYAINWPDPSDYNFTSSATSVNTTDLVNFLAAYTTTVSTAKSNSSNMQSAVDDFLNVDYAAQSSQFAEQFPTPIPTIDIPSFDTFNINVVQGVLDSVIIQLKSNLQLFSNQNASTDPSAASQEEIDTAALKQFTKQISSQGNAATPMGSIGGVAFVGLGGISSFGSITRSFNSQARNISKEIQAIPDVSNYKKDFEKDVSNYLQTAISAAVISGIGKAYQDAVDLSNPSPNLNGALILLNTLESFNALIGPSSTQADTVQTLANKSVDPALSVDPSLSVDPALVDLGSIPFTLATVAQRAVLVAQDVTGDKGSLTASYLASFAQNVLDNYATKGNLNTSQQNSVISAQSSLVGLITNNNVGFDFLESPDAQSQIANAFQVAGQQLQNLGYLISAKQLVNTQTAFYAGLSSASFTGNGTSASQVQSLLQRAAAALNTETEIPSDVLVNSVILQFNQNQESYRIQVKNQFQQTQNLNTSQVKYFSDRLREAAVGSARQESVDALLRSNKVTDIHFAEQLTNVALIQQDNILGTKVLEGKTEQIPGTDLLTGTIVARNDLTPVPTEKRTTFIPV